MKLSVSLTEADVARLDEYVRAVGLPTRSAGVQQAIRELAHQRLEDDYAAAFQEWEESGDADLWNAVTADGIGDR